MTGLRTLARTLGELMITAGLVLLLFCVYQLFWSNLQAHREQSRVSDSLRQQWRQPAGGDAAVPAFREGRGFAFLHIPALSRRSSCVPALLCLPFRYQAE